MYEITFLDLPVNIFIANYFQFSSQCFLDLVLFGSWKIKCTIKVII